MELSPRKLIGGRNSERQDDDVGQRDGEDDERGDGDEQASDEQRERNAPEEHEEDEIMSLTKEEMSKLPVLQLDRELVKGNATHMTKKAEKYAKVKEWLETPASQRMSIVLFRRTNKITRPMFEELKRNYLTNLDELRKQRARDASRYIDTALSCIDKPPGSMIDIEEDPMLWWKTKQKELNESILRSAVTGNAQSQKLAKQLAGELVEKSEIKIGLTAEERARRLFQAQEELKKEGF